MSKCFTVAYLLLCGLWEILLLSLYAAGCLLAFLGALVVADIYRDPHVPTIRPLHDPALLAAAEKMPRPAYRAGLTDEERWQILLPSLRLLDHVCPAAADYYRTIHAAGRLSFEDDDSAPYYALYRPGLDRVLVNGYTLREDPVGIADVLAHEYRHSRQGLLVNAEVVLARCLGLDRTELVEDEAWRFGHAVAEAISGNRRGP